MLYSTWDKTDEWQNDDDENDDDNQQRNWKLQQHKQIRLGYWLLYLRILFRISQRVCSNLEFIL